VAADATHEGITYLQHERSLLEVSDVGGPLGHVAGDGGQVCENAIGTDALHLVLLDRGARLALTPVHDRLVAVLCVGSHIKGVHGLRRRTALCGALGATDFVAEAGARSRAAFFTERSSQLIMKNELGGWRDLHFLWRRQYQGRICLLGQDREGGSLARTNHLRNQSSIVNFYF
jgi:hypothetical protein